MKVEALQEFFESELFRLKTENGFFNQYRSRVNGLDRRDGAKIRRENLTNYLNSFDKSPGVLLVGEAPGFHGCRFSGVPFTDESQLVSGDLPFAGCQSSVDVEPKKEQTATVFWKTMLKHHPRFFAWNTIPFHPHEANNHEKNRKPSTKEAVTYQPFLVSLIEVLQPTLIISVGNEAKRSLNRMGLESIRVRHPARGGGPKFSEEISKLLQNLLRQ